MQDWQGKILESVLYSRSNQIIAIVLLALYVWLKPN